MEKTLAMETKISKACKFFNMAEPAFYSITTEDKLKELCVIKLCEAIGIRCAYNFRTGFLGFFSEVMGEAVSNKLDLSLCIAKPNIRFVKYNHVNLIQEVEFMLETEELEEAFLDAFNFLERFKDVIA